MVCVKYSNYMNWYNMAFKKKKYVSKIWQKNIKMQKEQFVYDTSIVFKNSNNYMETFFI